MHYPLVIYTVFSILVCSIYIHNILSEEYNIILSEECYKFMSCTIQNPKLLNDRSVMGSLSWEPLFTQNLVVHLICTGHTGLENLDKFKQLCFFFTTMSMQFIHVALFCLVDTM